MPDPEALAYYKSGFFQMKSSWRASGPFPPGPVSRTALVKCSQFARDAPWNHNGALTNLLSDQTRTRNLIVFHEVVFLSQCMAFRCRRRGYYTIYISRAKISWWEALWFFLHLSDQRGSVLGTTIDCVVGSGDEAWPCAVRFTMTASLNLLVVCMYRLLHLAL
jgi:hypothetical protein